MPGPRRSLTDYLTDRAQQFGDVGGVVRSVQVDEIGQDAILQATITFGESSEGVLNVFEYIRMEEGRPHRFKYGYQCSYDGSYIFRYDRDPTGHPDMPEHKHVTDRGERVPSGRKTLHDVADELWTYVADRQDDEEQI